MSAPPGSFLRRPGEEGWTKTRRQKERSDMTHAGAGLKCILRSICRICLILALGSFQPAKERALMTLTSDAWLESRTPDGMK